MGNPGVQALWLEARKRKIKVTKRDVEDLVSTRGEKQIFRPVVKATGKSVSEDVDSRYQMDLADLRNMPAAGTGKRAHKTYKFFLVVINVFTRELMTATLKTKEPQEVVTKLHRLLHNKPKPTVISSDNGSEFTSAPMQDYLKKKGITMRFKAVGDVNALGIIDAAIQKLKIKIGELMAANDKGTWVEYLPKATEMLNKTPKPQLLHGAAPSEVRNDQQVRFMLLQDQANNIEHNRAQTAKRVDKLQETNSFRAPLAESTSKFKRSFQATFGGVRQV